MGSVLDAPLPAGRATGGRQGRRTLVIGCGFIGSNVATQIASGEEPPVVLTRSRPVDQVVAAVGEANIRGGGAWDESGWLCEPRDLSALAEGLDRALRSSAEQQKRGKTSGDSDVAAD